MTMPIPALKAHPVIRACMIAGAIGWVGIAYTSARVRSPFLDLVSADTWVLLCGMTAGSLLAVVRWGTLFALRTYVILSMTVGVLRSISYGRDGAWGPMWVWVLVGSTTLALYVVLAEGRKVAHP